MCCYSFPFIQMCVCPVHSVKQRSYKTSGRRQYHSPSSGGSREGRNVDRLETAEFLRMALDELGLSICGSWGTDGEAGRGYFSSLFHFTVKKVFQNRISIQHQQILGCEATANCQKLNEGGFRNARRGCLTQLYLVFKHKQWCDTQEYEKRLFCFKPKCHCGKFKRCMWPLDWPLHMCVCVCARASPLVFGLLIKLRANGLVISARPVPASIKCHSSALLLHNDIYSEL